MQNDISSRLKILIDLLGLNLKDFSRQTGVPYTTLQDYIAGKRLPGAENLQKISRQLHVSIDWLLTGEGEPFIKNEKNTNSFNVVNKENSVIGSNNIVIQNTNTKNDNSKIKEEERIVELIEAFKKLSKKKQDYFYYKIRAEALEEEISSTKNE